jgi:hypothetical protein
MWRFAIPGLVLMASVAVAQTPVQPSFESEKFMMKLVKLETESKLEFTSSRKTGEYTLQGEVMMATPKKLDVVAVSERLDISRVIGPDDRNLLKRSKSRSAASRRGSAKFVFVAGDATSGGVAKVLIPKINLYGAPYTIDTMVARCEAIVASKRIEKTLPARAMEQAEALELGIKVRVTNIKVGRDRKLSVQAEFTRPGGTLSPFLEGLTVIGEDDKEIGGGRWNDGDAFGSKGSIRGEFMIPRGAKYKELKFIIVKEYTKQRLEFEMKGGFQR